MKGLPKQRLPYSLALPKTARMPLPLCSADSLMEKNHLEKTATLRPLHCILAAAPL